MSLIQDPLRALQQTRWYLVNKHLELLPTAFSLAAGNLLRQVVEQMLFVLAFYSRMPKTHFIRTKNGQLQTAGRMLNALCSKHSGKTYFQIARGKHPYLRRIARPSGTFKRWLIALNDPSHFVNPSRNRRTQSLDLETITTEFEGLIDPTLYHLIIAAANELRTRGQIRAVLGAGPDYTIAMECDIVLRLKHLTMKDGSLGLILPTPPIRVASSEQAEPLQPSKSLLMIQNQIRPALAVHCVTPDGKPVDFTNLQAVLQSLRGTPAKNRALASRLGQLGLVLTDGWDTDSTSV